MQQPAGVLQMRTYYCNVKTLSAASCEKSILLRHAMLLPKIANAATYQSSVGQSITMLAPILTGIDTKRGNKALYSPGYRQK